MMVLEFIMIYHILMDYCRCFICKELTNLCLKEMAFLILQVIKSIAQILSLGFTNSSETESGFSLE